jgi:hypothetical protein
MKLAKILGRYPRYFPIPVGVFGGAWCSAVHDFEYPLELDKPTMFCCHRPTGASAFMISPSSSRISLSITSSGLGGVLIGAKAAEANRRGESRVAERAEAAAVGLFFVAIIFHM